MNKDKIVVGNKIKANRSGAEANIIDENELEFTVEYISTFTGQVLNYNKEAINKHWSKVNDDQ